MPYHDKDKHKVNAMFKEKGAGWNSLTLIGKRKIRFWFYKDSAEL